jgi:hypothetical protein
VLDTTSEGDTILLPDLTAVPGVNFWVERWKPNGDSVLVLSYDTSSSATAVDSATVDAIYTAWGLSAPAAYAMTVPGEPAEPPPIDTTAYYYLTFEDYTDWQDVYDNDMCDNPSQCRFYTPGTNVDSFVRVIDNTVAYTPAGLTKSLRYDFTYTNGTCDAATDGDICKAQTIISNVFLDTAVTSVSAITWQRVWFEVAYRMSDNYSACNVKDAPCDYKTLFVNVGPGDNLRWAYHMTGCYGASVAGIDANGWRTCLVSPSGVYGADGSAVATSSPVYKQGAALPNGVTQTMSYGAGYGDTAWHILRGYVDGGTSPDSNPNTHSRDGQFVMWLDGELIYDSEYHRAAADNLPWGTTNVSGGTDTLYVRYFSLGRNKDKAGHADTLANGNWAVPRTESFWWGYLKWWNTDPGWDRYPATTPVVTDASVSNWTPSP